MKKAVSALLILCFLLSTLLLSGCQTVIPPEDNGAVHTEVDLDMNNLWKYITISISGPAAAGSEASIHCEINGVLDYALYEDVVIGFNVYYYTSDQSDDEYQYYTMYIALNAAGNAEFMTTYLGTTSVKYGKWAGIDGELVNLHNYNRKIYAEHVSGKVIYSI